jgi:hypothetical protein
MRKRTIYVAALSAAALTVVVFTAAAAGGSSTGHGGGNGHGQLIAENSLLTGLSANSLFPFIDTTPHRMSKAHIAITDSTASCGGASPTAPTNIEVLVGQAGATLVNVMTASTNTGIGSSTQCVFHVTVKAGQGGVPSTVTDIVVRNKGAAALNGRHTVTASATVKGARSREDD